MAHDMHIVIDNRSGTPIYDQIYAQIKTMIINGNLGADELLPSIRNLAKDLRISVITTKRAYEELEREGFLYTVAGKGCFVAPLHLETIRETHREEVRKCLKKAVQLSESSQFTEEDLKGLIHQYMEEAYERKHD